MTPHMFIFIWALTILGSVLATIFILKANGNYVSGADRKRDRRYRMEDIQKQETLVDNLHKDADKILERFRIPGPTYKSKTHILVSHDEMLRICDGYNRIWDNIS